MLYPNVNFVYMNLFDCYVQILNSISDNQGLYKIFALQANGTISTFIFNMEKNQYYEKNITHMFRELSKSISLSGNIAIFLEQIRLGCQKYDAIVGYRNHKQTRLAREVALERILLERVTMQEPKNTLYYSLFDKHNDLVSLEEKANEVASDAFLTFLTDNKKTLKIS